MALNSFESEVVVLLAIKTMIDSMVNHNLLEIGDEPDTEVRFKTDVHGRLFNVLLVDLLSQTDKDAPVKKETYLQALKSVCDAPCISSNGVAMELQEATETFRTWVAKEIIIQNLWLPTLSLGVPLRIRRIDILKIAGNVCKHNFLRSTQTIRRLLEIFQENGVQADEEMSLLALDEIYEWFHSHKFNAYSNALAEYLNNIRWGIYTYLRPEFLRSFTRAAENSLAYSFKIPNSIKGEFAKSCYWQLMNEVRSAPFVHRFSVPEVFKADRLDRF